MDLRLLHLDHPAAGVGELVQLFIERIADREDRASQILVMQVAHRHGDELGRDGAELDRLRCLSLCGFPDGGVVQVAATDRPDEVGHHARLEHVVQDVAGLLRNPGLAAGAVETRPAETAHSQRRIREPVVARHIGIEAAVAVGDDIEARDLLVAQVARDRVQVLLAVRALDHGLAEVAAAQILRIPGRTRQ
jgi:hypothetical protein